MFEKHFAEFQIVHDRAMLGDLFQSDDIYLGAGASLKLRGKITLAPNVIFTGACTLDGPVSIEAGSQLTDVELGPDTRVRAYSILSALKAGNRNLFGPFCFVRDGCEVGDDVILGAHVEAARSRFASGVKVSHRAFIGDAEVGQGTILGAGTVFCNYIGEGGRQHIRIGAKVTVGSGTMLVAPLSIGDGAIIGAGSVITKDVPADARFIQKRARS
jgi:bifunctional UDP-N-acetylglucosamine pyrophosphorylase/glucosamine-1-phosphate N-acetyltransferase